MPATDVHPTDAALQAFTLGTLDGASGASLENHLTDCPSCQARAAGAPADTLVELLRRAHARPSVSEHTPAPSVFTATTLWPLTDLAAPSVPAELAGHARYRLLRQLGAGGMGAVWLAEHSVMGRQVALKVIRPEHLARPGAAERFRREVHAAACLHHPNIVTAYDADQAGATHFLVMEYVEGVSLAEHLERTGPLPVAEACQMARDAALGLQHAHEHGLIHRDIKPHNIMLTADGGVKILDFGLAALTAGSEEAAPLTGANMVVGTPDYIAPEQAEDAHRADIRSDVYSLGCTLYQMLAGRVPFPGDSVLRKLDAHRTQPPAPIRSLRLDVPTELAIVLAKMMAKDPANRYQTPAEVAAALTPFTGQRVVRPRRRWPLAVATVVLFAGLAAAVAVYRVETDKGQLVITTESDDVEVVIKQNGKEVRVIDTKTDKSITLWSGEYELELKDAGAGLKLNIDKATLTRGETVLAKIERVAKPTEQAQSQTWSAVEEIRALRTFTDHEKLPRHVIFSPDGKLLISASDDGTIRFWDIETGDEVVRRRLTIRSGRFFDVSVSSDGKQLLSIGDDGAAANPQLRQGRAHSAVLYIGGDDVAHNQLQLWDLSTGKVIREFPVPAVGVNSVRFSPDDRWAVSTHNDGSVRVWNVGTGKEVRSFTHPGPMGQAFSAEWSPDGRRIVSGNHNHLAVWEAEKGKIVREWLPPASFETVQVAFTRDGKRVVISDWDCLLKVFDIETGKSLLSARIQERTDGRAVLFALAPDNRRVLITAPLSTPELRELGTGKLLGRLVGHQEIVYGAAFSPDGRYAATTSEDLTIRLWRLPDPTAAELPQKSSPLFNGKDLTGWVVDGGDVEAWRVEDGELVGRGSGQVEWLLTEQSYSDFRLRLEFKLSSRTNSGVAFRAVPGEKDPTKNSWPLHLEVQILDDANYRGADGMVDSPTGSLFWNSGHSYLRPDQPADLKPIGDWNEMVIESRGDSLQTWVNGRRILNADLGRLAAQSDALPGLKRTSGRIGLQHQAGGEVRFRNIEIRATPAPKDKP